MSKKSSGVLETLLKAAAITGAAAVSYLLVKKANEYLESIALDESDLFDEYEDLEEEDGENIIVPFTPPETAQEEPTSEEPEPQEEPAEEPAQEEVTEADFADLEEPAPEDEE